MVDCSGRDLVEGKRCELRVIDCSFLLEPRTGDSNSTVVTSSRARYHRRQLGKIGLECRERPIIQGPSQLHSVHSYYGSNSINPKVCQLLNIRLRVPQTGGYSRSFSNPSLLTVSLVRFPYGKHTRSILSIRYSSLLSWLGSASPCFRGGLNNTKMLSRMVRVGSG